MELEGPIEISKIEITPEKGENAANGSDRHNIPDDSGK
jgi:hypothetical protein